MSDKIHITVVCPDKVRGGSHRCVVNCEGISVGNTGGASSDSGAAIVVIGVTGGILAVVAVGALVYFLGFKAENVAFRQHQDEPVSAQKVDSQPSEESKLDIELPQPEHRLAAMGVGSQNAGHGT